MNNLVRVIIVLFQLLIGTVYAQQKIKSITDPSFEQFISGVKYFSLNAGELKSSIGILDLASARMEQEIMNFLALKWNSLDIYRDQSTMNICDVVRVTYSYVYAGLVFNGVFQKIELVFTACDGEKWVWKLDFTVPYKRSKGYKSGVVLRQKLDRAFKKLGLITPHHQLGNRRELPDGVTHWNELIVKEYLTHNSANSIEGIYKRVGTKDSKYVLALIKESGVYQLIYLSGARDPGIWVVGDVKAYLGATATEKYFTSDYYMLDKSLNNNVYIEFKEGLMVINFHGVEESQSTYLKIFPVKEN